MSIVSEGRLSMEKRHTPIGVNSSEELCFEAHIVKATASQPRSVRLAANSGTGILVYYLIPIALDFSLGDILKFFAGYDRQMHGQPARTGRKEQRT